jgi:hypothetical protein
VSDDKPKKVSPSKDTRAHPGKTHDRSGTDEWRITRPGKPSRRDSTRIVTPKPTEPKK